MRCFVLGNGPSLKTHDLELMKDDVTFACNKIHLLYHTTSWRPTHWCSFDRTYYSTNIVEYLSHFRQGYQCHVSDEWFGFRNGRVSPAAWDNVHVWRLCDVQHAAAPDWDHVIGDRDAEGRGKFDLCRYNYTGALAIRIAIEKYGFDEVYVIGMDLGYSNDAYKNHFDPNYLPEFARSLESAQRLNCEMKDGHKKAAEEAKKRGSKIYNAGRVNKLTYPAVTYEDLF